MRNKDNDGVNWNVIIEDAGYGNVYPDVAWSASDEAARFDKDVEAEKERINELLIRYTSTEARAYLWGAWSMIGWMSGNFRWLPSDGIKSYREFKQKRWGEFKWKVAQRLQEYLDTFKRGIY